MLKSLYVVSAFIRPDSHYANWKICKGCNFPMWGTAGCEQDGAVGDIYKPEPSNENEGFTLSNPKPGVLV